MLIDYLQLYPVAFITVSILLGLVVGSFLNVVIARLPIMMEQDWRARCAQLCGRACDADPVDGREHRARVPRPFNLMLPRSHCLRCGHFLSIAENIPLVSYLLLRGRCAGCHAPIPLRYPLVELLGAGMAGIVAWRFGFGIQAGSALILTWALIALAFIDWEHWLLPDGITIPLLWLGLGLNLFSVHATIADAVIGAICGYGVFWMVYHVHRLLTGKEGMGHGDFKLLAMSGAWLGWQVLPTLVLIASLIGVLAGVVLIRWREHDRNDPIPFGPCLAIATWAVLLWKDTLAGWYLGP
uniref:Prepilin leader peptidase/N-methyltransferase n=1 Tax=Candidatus Kentrum sp. DK TaxID=2126562 RepID=A0A450TPH8_9GAMM|nr:MAG: type 4 prepilin peptidase 1 Aspartic peptidase. MEROPS family A24A [Candidatus Kentron sp. DK]